MLRLLNPTHWPLPGGCWICRDWSRDRLCTACRERFAPPVLRCPACALALQGPHCAPCLREPMPLSHVHAAVDYAAPWSTLLHTFKYQNALGLAPAFAQLLCRSAQVPTDALLLPVPLHAQRLGERGYNQAAVLAEHLAPLVKLPLAPDGLRRLIDTPTQTQLNRKERLKNLSQAFALAPGFSVQGRHCLLVDDVMTTGATLATLATLLLRHGATRVDAWVVARTPAPG